MWRCWLEVSSQGVLCSGWSPAHFKSDPDIFAYPPRLIAKSFSAAAFTAVLNDPQELRYFVNSYVVGLAVTALTILVALVAAYRH